MADYDVNDIARTIIAMYLSDVVKSDMEKKGFVPVKTGQDPMAAMMGGGMPPGGAPPGMPPGAPMGGPPGAPPMGMPGMGAPPGMPPDMGGMGAPPGGGDLGGLMSLLGGMPPPPPPSGTEEKTKEEETPPEGEKGFGETTGKGEVTPTVLYAELVKVRKLLLGLYDKFNISVPADALSDEEVYLGKPNIKEEVRQSPKEREQTTPEIKPLPEGATAELGPTGAVPPETIPPAPTVPPEIKKALLRRRA